MHKWLPLLAIVFLTGAARPPDIAFQTRMIDPGWNETAAVADLNNDGKPDIVSGENWYEAPNWIKHPLREINFTGNYVDNFSDLTLDVDGDGWIDVVQVAYFSRNLVWLKNPGKAGGPWKVSEIDASGGSNEFAILVDLDNDGKAREILSEFTRAPLSWYEWRDGKWVKHQVGSRFYGHGIGAGDVNGDGRNDILTPEGWLEAPADPRAPGEWVFHPTGWERRDPNAAPNVLAPAVQAPAGPRATAFAAFVQRPATQVVWSEETGRIEGNGVSVVFTALKAKDPTVAGAIGMGVRVTITQAGKEQVFHFGGMEMQAGWSLVLGEAARLIPGYVLSNGSDSPGKPPAAADAAVSRAMKELNARPFSYDEGWNPTPRVASASRVLSVDNHGVTYTIELPSEGKRSPVDAPPDFTAQVAPVPGTAPRAPVVAPLEFGFMYMIDINGDGRKDLLTTNGHDYGIYWFEQTAGGSWTRRVIDSTWSQAHASALVDINGDGQLDLVTGKRYMAHNGTDPGEREPLGVYWYEYRKGPNGGAIEWIRHIVDYGGRMGGGMQIQVADLDGDGDLDIVSGGKAGVFLAENLTRSPSIPAARK